MSLIVDCHSHYFRYPDHFSADFVQQAKRARRGVDVDLTVRWPDYEADATACGVSIVFGGKAKLAGLAVPDEEVAAYAKQQPGRLVPFLSLDPTQPGWHDEMVEGHQNARMQGIKLMPMYAGFKPTARGSRRSLALRFAARSSGSVAHLAPH